MPSLRDELPEMQRTFEDDFAQKQRRQMLIALTLLLAALIVVLTKDREFWFSSPSPALQTESEPTEETGSEPASPSAAATTTTRPAVPALKAKTHNPPAAAAANAAAGPTSVVTQRAVLPPLEVEVVAGDEHHAVQAGNNSVKVDLHPPSTSAPAASTAAATAPASEGTGVSNATARVRLSPGTSEVVSRPVEPKYPLLAKQMKIQGAVVLQALIGRDGNIQTLSVLSGPTILSDAAREAVKRWRFRPYLQAGRAVETEARMTVNFTIMTE